MNVVPINFLHSAYKNQNIPIVIFMNMQKEYVSTGRAYALDDVTTCLKEGIKLLDFVRSQKIPVAHFRRINQGPYFNNQTVYSQWIDDFKPYPHEMTFVHNGYSLYENESFERFIDEISVPNLIVAGLSGDMNCLPSAIDAAKRQHKFCYVKNASASFPLGLHNQSETHNFISNLIERFADVYTADEIINLLNYKKEAAVSNHE